MRSGVLAPHLRAAFVALHLMAITAMALPSAGAGLRRSAWKDPTVQQEIGAWSQRLQAVGLDLAPAELEQVLWDTASGWERVRGLVLAPFRPYYRYCGTWQSWRMFVAPHRFPARLEIEVDEGGGWVPVFVERSDEHTWMRPAFDHDRWRAAIFRYGWSHYRQSRDQFADWVARRAAVDFPAARSVRVSFVRYRSPSADDVLAGREPEEERELIEVRPLETLRVEAP